jgi:glycosyltransferase involved in cell wall biosynthesis
LSNKLKIVFIVRSTLFKVIGGDHVQVINTAEQLRQLGVHVDIKLAGEKFDPNEYDLVHLFNIIRPADHLRYIRNLRKPLVVSTIYLDYTDFDRWGRGWVYNKLLNITGKNGAEYLKSKYRFLRSQDKLVSIEYVLGHKRAVKKILSKADLLLPNSRNEYSRLLKEYGIDNKIHIIPNGISREIFKNLPNVDRFDDQVVCVGQIYGLKNQHSLIQAVKELGVRLTIIGKSPPNHRKYLDYCKSIASSKTEFVDFIPQQDLLKYYASSKVHALPSWFETTGLSSLEAGVMGCNLVVGIGGDTGEYFKDKASFCYANDLESIVSALKTELEKPVDNTFRDYVLENYTWANAASETLKAYNKILNEKR